MKRCRAPVVAVASVLLLACGGSGSKSTSSQSPPSPRTGEQLEADRRTAEAAILHASDFPAGWESSPRTPAASSPENIAASQKLAECLAVEPAVVIELSDFSSAAARSDLFAAGDQEVTASAIVHESPGNMQMLIAALQKPSATRCLEEFLATSLSLRLSGPASADSSTGHPFDNKVEVTRAEIAGFHVDVVLYRSTSSATLLGVTVTEVKDFVIALKGRTTLDLTFRNFDVPFPQDLEVELANKVIDRTPAA